MIEGNAVQRQPPRNLRLPTHFRTDSPGITCTCIKERSVAMLCAIEDNCQYGLKKGALLAVVDEDIAKFYDTISGLFQAHCLRQMGCPHHGYIDWLHVFDDLGPNTVIVKTVDYYIYSTFTNGLRQGKGFSCPAATIVAAYVVEKWPGIR